VEESQASESTECVVEVPMAIECPYEQITAPVEEDFLHSEISPFPMLDNDFSFSDIAYRNAGQQCGFEMINAEEDLLHRYYGDRSPGLEPCSPSEFFAM
jgi:hypothetical protein